MRGTHLILVGAIVALATGCSSQPPSRATAERLCASEASLADGVAGSIGVGVGSDGPAAEGGAIITTDVFNPRSEAEAMNTCVQRRMAGGGAAQPEGLTIGIQGSFETDS